MSDSKENLTEELKGILENFLLSDDFFELNQETFIALLNQSLGEDYGKKTVGEIKAIHHFIKEKFKIDYPINFDDMSKDQIFSEVFFEENKQEEDIIENEPNNNDDGGDGSLASVLPFKSFQTEFSKEGSEILFSKSDLKKSLIVLFDRIDDTNDPLAEKDLSQRLWFLEKHQDEELYKSALDYCQIRIPK